MQVSAAECVVLIARQFVGTVRAQTPWPAQEVLWNAGVTEAERAAAFRGEKNRARLRYRLEIAKSHIHGRKILRCSGAGIHIAKQRVESIAAPRNNGVVRVIDEQRKTEIARAPGNRGELRRAQP